MSERVLVTGGAGFIGSHLCDALLARGDEVRVLDVLLEQAHPTGSAEFLSKSVELVRGDVRDRAVVDAALAGVQTVFHLAGIVGNGQSMYDIRRYIDLNAVGTATFLEALIARRAQFRRIVLTSSMVVYGDGAYACAEHGTLPFALRPASRLVRNEWEPICPRCGAVVVPVAACEDQPLRPNSVYGISKRDQEELGLVLGRLYELPLIALRLLCTYGSRQALANPYTGVAAIWASRMLNGRAPIVFEDGRQQRDLIHVRDVVRAHLAAADAPPEAVLQAYNVGTGRPFRILDLARLLARALGKDCQPEVTGTYRDGDIRHCFADVQRARDQLGFRAEVSLEDGIAELASWAAGRAPHDGSDEANAELRRLGILR
jgi:dTDP-L-rhamnose 4-epimerase